MQRLRFKNGLLFTDISLLYNNKEIIINNMVVDTGAFHTIIDPIFPYSMGIEFSHEDTLVKASGYGGMVSYSVRKKIDKIMCGDIELENFKVDFGVIDPTERINGLLGLDFLKKSQIVIDLVNLTISKKTN